MLGLNIPSESCLWILIIAWKVYCGMFHFVAAFLCCNVASLAKVAKVQPLASSLLRIMINTEILEKISIW